MWEPVTAGNFQYWRQYEFEGWFGGGPGYSSHIDKPHVDNIDPRSMLERYLRLAVTLRIPREERAAFAADFDKFRRRVSANYDIRGEERNWRSRHRRRGYDVFSSLHDGTLLRSDGTAIHALDRRLAKVKNFLRRHLRREPTDKEVDWTIYLYFGSDAMSMNQYPLFAWGMQSSFYNLQGTRRERIWAFGERMPMPRIQRSQLRIRTWNPDTGAVTYHEPGANSNNSNNSNSNSNNRPNAVAYLRNKPAVKRNQNRNKSNNAKKIQWKENAVNNMPEDHIAGHNFSNGQKAVKYTYGRVSQYLLPQSFRNQARMSMTDAYNKPGSFTVFKNPFTRANLKRSNISFVILKNKNRGRATKLKTQAAKKIQTARRKQVKKRVSARRTLLANAASKRKRSPK